MEAAFLEELIKTLEDRFAKNMRRHTGIDWSSVQAKLEASPEKLQALYEMERTGGEPDSYSAVLPKKQTNRRYLRPLEIPSCRSEFRSALIPSFNRRFVACGSPAAPLGGCPQVADEEMAPMFLSTEEIDTSIRWLLENATPPVRYLTYRHILKTDPRSKQMLDLWGCVENSSDAKCIFSKQNEDGSWFSGGPWGPRGYRRQTGSGFTISRPKFVTTAWILPFLGEMGFTVDDERIRRSCEHMLQETGHHYPILGPTPKGGELLRPGGNSLAGLCERGHGIRWTPSRRVGPAQPLPTNRWRLAEPQSPFGFPHAVDNPGEMALESKLCLGILLCRPGAILLRESQISARVINSARVYALAPITEKHRTHSDVGLPRA